MQYTFTLYGVEGPPASVLEAIVAAKAGGKAPPSPEQAGVPATKLDLLAAYDSDSEGEEGRKGSNAVKLEASEQPEDVTAEVVAAEGDEEKKVNQWESIEEEEEQQDGKSMSQWLIEKQVPLNNPLAVSHSPTAQSLPVEHRPYLSTSCSRCSMMCLQPLVF